MKHALIPAARASEDYLDLMFTRKYLDPLPDKSTCKEAVVHVHHAAPKSLAPGFRTEAWNLIPLKLEEHVRAHELLSVATRGRAKIAMAHAFTLMIQAYQTPDGAFDLHVAEEALRIANAANSVAQSQRLTERWQDPDYRQQQSMLRSEINSKNWQVPQYRARQSRVIAEGRQRRFESDPDFKKDVYLRKAEKMSGKQHFNAKPVNIYDHETGLLVAENVCLSEWCRDQDICQPHLYNTIHGDRRFPSSRKNRTHHAGYFARYLDEDGCVVGRVTPAVSKAVSKRARPADLYRYADDSLAAENIIVSSFVKEPFEGVQLSQQGLSATAFADPDLPASSENRLQHKGYYIVYRVME